MSVLVAVLLVGAIGADATLIEGINYSLKSDGTATVIEGSTSVSGELFIPSAVLHWTSTTTYDVYYVTGIGSYAFQNCRYITSVVIPYTIKSIGSYAFYGCNSLMTVTNYSNEITIINPYTYYGCSSLSYFTIPGTVREIGDDAFHGCSSLQSITIPNTVTKIGSAAFENCTLLSSLSIPRSVSYINGNIIRGCREISSITVASDNSVYDSRNNCNAIIRKSDNMLLAGCKNTVIPNTVKTIGEAAFYGCTGLTSIDIPESVNKIVDLAFMGCNNLSSVTSRATTPPVMADSDCFSTASYQNATLKVPSNAVNVYSSTNYWKRFTHIEGLGGGTPDPTPAVGDINGDGEVNIGDINALIDIIFGRR